LFLLKRVVYDRYISQSSIIIKKKLINKTISRLNNVKDYGEI
jgi:hypothetical protein